MIDRRRFLQLIAAAASSPPALAASGRHHGFGPLQPDPQRILDLPAGFRYDIIAAKGEEMSDGLLVPAEADGMAAFSGDGKQVIIVCNHENAASEIGSGPFGYNPDKLAAIDSSRIYDAGAGLTPGTGGTSTIIWDPESRQRISQHMSLIGTEVNCAGGATPWGSWLSCEECFKDPGRSFEKNQVVSREQRHGYVFEVPARATGAVRPVPLVGMGRFEHEAAAVDPQSGIVYLSEDRHRSLLYRFVPDVPGSLARGGRLQALAISGKPAFDTRNWDRERDIEPGQRLPVTWIDLPDPDVDDNDLRLRGIDLGAARFARGEGLCVAGSEIVLTCTIGGSERLGQIFAYRPDRNNRSGELRLLAESDGSSLLRHADNLTFSPWGDLVVCEDTASHCGLVGLQPDGRQYPLADNAYDNSELAGVCFSPDGSEMFVNIQKRGLTLAIRGPWEKSAA